MMEVNQGTPIGDYSEAIGISDVSDTPSLMISIKRIRTFLIIVSIGISNIIYGNSVGPLTVAFRYWELAQRAFLCDSFEHLQKKIP